MSVSRHSIAVALAVLVSSACFIFEPPEHSMIGDTFEVQVDRAVSASWTHDVELPSGVTWDFVVADECREWQSSVANGSCTSNVTVELRGRTATFGALILGESTNRVVVRWTASGLVDSSAS